MMYYLKQAFFAFIYLFFMMIIALGILCIGVPWVEFALSILNIALYGFIISMTFYKEGQNSMKVLHSNDIEREQIIKTGEPRKLKIHEEYKPWKGYVIGLIVCVPLLVCLLLHIIIALSSGGTLLGAGAVAGFIYLAFFAPCSVFFETATVWTYFYILYAVPLIMLMCGIPYNLGASKIQRQYDRIAEKQRQIYGDKL